MRYTASRASSLKILAEMEASSHRTVRVALVCWFSWLVSLGCDPRDRNVFPNRYLLSRAGVGG